MNFCPNCGKKIEQSWKVCSECGTKLDWLRKAEESKDNCPQCGVHVEPDWKVCSSCGNRLKKKEEVEHRRIEGVPRKRSKKCFLVVLIVLVVAAILFFVFVVRTKSSEICDEPFLQSNGEICCLDEESRNPCSFGTKSPSGESGEVGLQTTLQAETTTLRQVGGSEVSSTTSTLLVTSTLMETTTLGRADVSCVGKYGVASDTVLYLYTKKCCDPLVGDRVRAVEGNGFSFRWIDIESMSTEDKQVLGCFVLGDLYAPSFICPASGKGLIMTEPAGMQTKIENFARECGGAANGTSTTVKPSDAVKCTTNADCGKTKSEYICISGDVYLKKEIPICRSPGTEESNCIFSVTGLKSPEDSCGKDETCVPGESKCQKLED